MRKKCLRSGSSGRNGLLASTFLQQKKRPEKHICDGVLKNGGKKPNDYGCFRWETNMPQKSSLDELPQESVVSNIL